MEQVQVRIDKIVRARAAMLPQVESLLRQADAVESSLESLRRAFEALPPDLREDHEVAVLAQAALTSLAKFIDESRVHLSPVRQRLARSTVNIGVTGQARMGKSTLLRTISGLGDDQIPTGDGPPVTAVRSQIFHSPGEQRALVSFHSEQSFLREVVGPYCHELDLRAPSTLRAVAAIPLEEVDTDDRSGRHERVTLRRRLREIIESLDSVAPLLTGDTQAVPLEHIRRFVAYPIAATKGVDRPYLAVREVRVEAAFPLAPVQGLGLIDLPGLGEIAAAAESRHTAGLQNSVDFVLMVKRPEGNNLAMWSVADSHAVDLVTRASPTSGRRGEFLAFVVNASATEDPQAVKHLEGAARTESEEGGENGDFNVYVVDVADRARLHAVVVTPVLELLADRLPHIDRAVLEAATVRSTAARAEALGRIHSLKRKLASSTVSSGNVRTNVDRAAAALRRDIASSLRRLISTLEREVRTGEQVDRGYINVVRSAATQARAWARAGLSRGDQAAWERWATDQMYQDRSSGTILAPEIGAARVEIARHFRPVNDYVNEVQVPRLIESVAAILGKHLGDLGAPLLANPGRETLLGLTTTLAIADDTLDSLVVAIDELSNLTIPFGTEQYGRVREELEEFRPQIEDENGNLVAAIVVEPTSQGARQLYTYLTGKASQAIYEIEKGLIEDAGKISEILLNVAQLFEDSLVRFHGADEEFRSLAHAFRDEIWPGEYTGLDSNNARIREVASILSAVSEQVADSKSPTHRGEAS